MRERESDVGRRIHSPLACSDLVYRLARRRSDLDPDTGEFSPEVFKRQPYDEDGLSVVIADVVSVEEARTNPRYAKRCYGVATLHVGRIRDKGLDVVPDDVDHAVVGER